jgi:hypothetical protein
VGVSRLRPAHVPYAADSTHTHRTDEVARLPLALTHWLTTTGARLLAPTLDDPTWRIRCGPRLVATASTAHNAIRAAQAQLRHTPLDACPHLGA